MDDAPESGPHETPDGHASEQSEERSIVVQIVLVTLIDQGGCHDSEDHPYHQTGSPVRALLPTHLEASQPGRLDRLCRRLPARSHRVSPVYPLKVPTSFGPAPESWVARTRAPGVRGRGLEPRLAGKGGGPSEQDQ
jgi:hypothetical protein